jgi:replicative DNA helicase
VSQCHCRRLPAPPRAEASPRPPPRVRRTPIARKTPYVTLRGFRGKTPRATQKTYPLRQTHPDPFPLSGRQKEEGADAPASPPFAGPTQAEIDAGFDEWWAHYPRKDDKLDAKRVYTALVSGKRKDGFTATIPQLLAAVKRFRPTGDRQYIKLPATWLNKGSWQDSASGAAAAAASLDDEVCELAGTDIGTKHIARFGHEEGMKRLREIVIEKPKEARLMTDIPSNREFEGALLAAILRDNAVLDSVDWLDPQYFFDAQLREFFIAARALRQEGRPINIVTLRGLMDADPLGGATVADRLKAVSFDGAAPSPRDLADAITDRAHRRELQAFGEMLMNSAVNFTTKPVALAEMMMREGDRLLAAGKPAGQTYWTAPEAMNEALDRLSRDDPADRVPTGITALDRKTGGLHRRQTIYLAARPSMGKSATAVVTALNAAKAGHGVLYVSLEMTLEQLEARIASAATFGGAKPIPYDRALNRQLSDEEHERFIRAGLARAILPIAIEERPGLSVVEIASRVRKTAQEFAGRGQRLGLVIIDLLGKVRARDARIPLVQQLGQISNDLTSLAKSENVALLVLHQLNRGVEGRDNKRPNMAACATAATSSRAVMEFGCCTALPTTWRGASMEKLQKTQLRESWISKRRSTSSKSML